MRAVLLAILESLCPAADPACSVWNVYCVIRSAVEDLLKSYNQMTVLFTSVAEYVSTRLESLKVSTALS